MAEQIGAVGYLECSARTGEGCSTLLASAYAAVLDHAAKKKRKTSVFGKILRTGPKQTPGQEFMDAVRPVTLAANVPEPVNDLGQVTASTTDKSATAARDSSIDNVAEGGNGYVGVARASEKADVPGATAPTSHPESSQRPYDG